MTAIEFENISKQYRLGLVSTRTLSHDLNRWWTVNVRGKEDPYLRIGETNDRSVKGASDYVWALKDINFKVEQGDVVGIIGRNGAGKSTLLKLLSRVTAPTTGQICARGRIGSLLEVGTGFHQEMTGRENIYMNGAILGMTRAEVSRKLDEIVDFSGCERYLDTPVKRYSSGMMVRLGFAVAAHLDPEILVVDEVLAVGDAEFQKKAIGKMKDVSQGEGRTVLFVSHNMGAVRNLCSKGILLNQGCVDFMGSSSECIDRYLSISEGNGNHNWREGDKCGKIIRLSENARFIEIGFEASNTFNTLDPIPFVICIEASVDILNCRVNMTLTKTDGTPVGTVLCAQFFEIKKGERKTIRFTIFNHNLVTGDYNCSFSVGVGSYNTGYSDFEIVHDVVCFTIDRYSSDDRSGYTKWINDWGSNYFPHKLEVLDKF